MNYLRVSVLIFFVVVSCVVGVFFAYLRFNVYDVKEYDVYSKVSNYTGINVDTDALYFGSVQAGMDVSRLIELKNDKESHGVEVIASGGIKPWISIKESRFILGPDEERDVEIRLSVPEYAHMGDYAGKVFVVFKRVL